MILRFKPHFSCLSNNADTCLLNISVSTQTLKPMKFSSNVHEIGGVFDNPPIPEKLGPLLTNLL